MLFTIGYISYQYYRRKTFKKRVEMFKKIISEQMLVIHQHRPVAEKHRAFLNAKLTHINYLTAYHAALKDFSTNDHIDGYKMTIEPVIKHLVSHYENRDDMEKAYLSFFIATHADGLWHEKIIYQTLFNYLDEPNVYLRENVLKAMYQQNNPEWIIKAYKRLSEQHIHHHEKLIQDGLMTYPHDKSELMEALFNQRKYFSESIVLGMIGFITYETKDYQDVFYHWLHEDKLTLNVELKLFRYFKKYPLEKVKPILLQALKSDRSEKRIVAADVLGAYCCQDVIDALKEAIADKDWYVRRNASVSLLKTDITIDDIMEILTGHDRYARAMLKYHLELEGG